MDIKQWLIETSGHRITDGEVAEILEVSRKTANKRLNSEVGADDLIKLCRALDINPVDGLVELRYINYRDVLDFFDSEGQIIDTAEDGDLALELARRLNPATRADELEELRKRRASKNVTPSAYSDSTQYEGKDLPYAADSSPVEPEPGDDDYSDGP